jgi:rod shape-determining protein MreD
MDRIAPTHMIWSKRATFVALSLIVLTGHLLPLTPSHRSWSAPDLLVAFSFAWVIRRPEFVPPVLLAVVLLTADFLLQRPPGLWAVLTLLGCEYLRARQAGGPDANFLTEWFSVIIAIAVMTVASRIVLIMLVVPQPTLSTDLMKVLLTALMYPLAVWITRVPLGVRRLNPLDAERARRWA